MGCHRICVFVVWLGLVLGGCAAPIAAQSAHYDVTMMLEQEGLGKRTVVIRLADLSGNPVDDAIITLLPVMRQHGMLAPPIMVKATTSGEYVFPDVNLDMSGEWQMQLTIVVGSTKDMIEIPVVIK